VTHPRMRSAARVLVVTGLTWLGPAQAIAQTVFIHRVTPQNLVSGHVTAIENPAARNPSAVLLVTPRTDGGARVTRPIGVYFAGDRWAIFTEDRTPMPVGAAFNVEILPAGQTAFVARVGSGPAGNNWAPLSSPALDGNPGVMPIVTQFWEAGTGVYNPHHIGVWYTGGQWMVFNQDRAAMPPGAAFHVVVGPAKLVEAGSPAIQLGADAVLQATSVYGSSSVYCDTALAVQPGAGGWTLAAADGSALPARALFFVRQSAATGQAAPLAVASVPITLAPLAVAAAPATTAPSGTCTPGTSSPQCGLYGRCVPTSTGTGWCSFHPEGAMAFNGVASVIRLGAPAEGDRPAAGELITLHWAPTPEMRQPDVVTMAAIMDTPPRISAETRQIMNPERIRWYWISQGQSGVGEARLADGFAGVSATGVPGPRWAANRGLGNGRFYWFVYTIRGGQVTASSTFRMLLVGQSCSTAALSGVRCTYPSDCVNLIEVPAMNGCAVVGGVQQCLRLCLSNFDCCGGGQVCDFANVPASVVRQGVRAGICR